MNYKPEESALIDYLYGELSAEETKKVEAFLSGYVEAQKELDELKSTLSMEGQLKDKEVEAPSFTFNESSKVVVGDVRSNDWWKYPLGIAASVAFLMMMGYLTSFRVSNENGGLTIAFGEASPATEQTFTKSQVQEMIADAMDRNSKLVDQKITSATDDLILKTSQNQSAEVDQQLLNDYIMRLRQYNAETVARLLEDSELEQRRYTDQIIQDFAAFVDLQRQDDMGIIQARLDRISDDASSFNRRTDQILTSLFSIEETTNENQY